MKWNDDNLDLEFFTFHKKDLKATEFILPSTCIASSLPKCKNCSVIKLFVNDQTNFPGTIKSSQQWLWLAAVLTVSSYCVMNESGHESF